jgi:sugar/nucleoside kinase (ribokinase family)/fructoselysine-6-P-deglycase FrlB-like protein
MGQSSHDNGNMSPPALIVVGNLTIDDVVRPDGTTSMGTLGGNTVHASVAAAIWGVRVGVVARVGEDFPVSALRRLSDGGVDTSGLRPVTGKTVRNWVIYEDDGRRTWVYRTSPGRSLEVAPQPEDLPSAWTGSGSAVVHVAPMPLPAAGRVVEALRTAAVRLVTLDTHEDWSSDGDTLLGVARQVDVFLPSREELVAMLGYDTPERACDELVKSGVPAVVVKCGPQGAFWATRAGLRGHVPAADVSVVDVTGAGDSFCGGLAAGLAMGDSLGDATRRGSATAGAAIGASGSLRLLEGRAPIAVQLLEQFEGKDNKPGAPHVGYETDRREIDVMRREIATIPDVISAQLSPDRHQVADLASYIADAGRSELVLVGCGDSAFAGQAAILAFNRHCRLRARASHALDFARYDVRYLTGPAGVVTVSYSGKVGRTIEAARQAHLFGHDVVALTRDANTPLAAEANRLLQVEVPTLGFAPGTSTYIGMLVSLLYLAGELAATGSNDNLKEHLAALPKLAAETLRLCEEPVLTAASRLSGARVVTFLGAGPNEASAKFGAAKVVEGAQLLSKATNLEEWAHEEYFTTQPGDPVVVVAPRGAASDRAAEILSELSYVGATIVAISDEPIGHDCTHLPLPSGVPEELSPVLAALPLSQLGFHLAHLSGKRSYNFQSKEAEIEHYDTIHRATLGVPA